MEKILEQIDEQWVAENPKTVLELLNMINEDRKRTKKYIDALERMISDLKSQKLLIESLLSQNEKWEEIKKEIEESF